MQPDHVTPVPDRLGRAHRRRAPDVGQQRLGCPGLGRRQGWQGGHHGILARQARDREGLIRAAHGQMRRQPQRRQVPGQIGQQAHTRRLAGGGSTQQGVRADALVAGDY
jgi:hypothetical protein